MNNDNQSFSPNQNPIPEPINPAPTPAPQPAPQPIAEPAPALTPEPQPAPEPSPAISPVQPLPAQPSPIQPAPTIPDSDPMPNIPVRSPKSPVNTRMIALIIIAAALVVCAVVAIIMIANANNNKTPNNPSPSPAVVDKDFTDSFDLTEQSANLEITEPGVYELTGELIDHSVIVNANGEVTLYLNNATISAVEMAAIANVSPNALTIELADGTENILSDGGASDYDGCIYSDGALTIKGDSGKLDVTGKQAEGEGITTKSNDITIDGGVINVFATDDGINAGGDGGTITINDGEIFIQADGDGIDSNKDLIINGGATYVVGSSNGGNAGIDTETGYTINGGTLIALGSDMLEKPSDNSKQNTLVITLDKAYDAKSTLAILDSGSNEIVKVTAGNSFRTIIYSSSSLKYGTYSVAINNETVIEAINVMNTITTYGDTDPEPEDGPSPDSPDNPAPENDQASGGDQLLSNGTDTYGRIPISDLPQDQAN